MSELGGQTFFEKVATRVDRERVYNILVERALPFLIYNDRKQSLKLTPKHIMSNRLTLEAPIYAVDFVGQQVIMSFTIGAEKYFMKTKLEEGRERLVWVDTNSDLFKLQRRNTFRLNIPHGYSAKVDVLSRGGNPSRDRFDIADISGGGLAFEFSSSHKLPYTRGENLFMRVTLGPDFQSDLYGVIRHVRMVGSRGSGLARVGVEFDGIKPGVQDELITIVMDLHREMFRKFKLEG